MVTDCWGTAFSVPSTGRLFRLVSSLVLPSPMEQLCMINLHSCTMAVLSASSELALHSYSMLNSAVLDRAMGIMCRDWKKEPIFCIKKRETWQQKQKSEIKDDSLSHPDKTHSMVRGFFFAFRRKISRKWLKLLPLQDPNMHFAWLKKREWKVLLENHSPSTMVSGSKWKIVTPNLKVWQGLVQVIVNKSIIG